MKEIAIEVSCSNGMFVVIMRSLNQQAIKGYVSALSFLRELMKIDFLC